MKKEMSLAEWRQYRVRLLCDRKTPTGIPVPEDERDFLSNNEGSASAQDQRFVNIKVPAAPLGLSFIDAPDSQGEYADNKYKTTQIFQADQLAAVEAALKPEIDKLAKEVLGDKFGDDFKYPWRIHDEDDDHEALRNTIVVTAKSAKQPKLIGGGNKPLPARIKLWSGDVVEVGAHLYIYSALEPQFTVIKGKQSRANVAVHGCALRLSVVKLIEKRACADEFSLFDPTDGYTSDVDKAG